MTSSVRNGMRGFALKALPAVLLTVMAGTAFAQAEIADAASKGNKAEIERLHALLAEVPSSPPNELRRRNQPLSDDGSTVGETEGGTGVEDPLQPEGVPLQVVVIIALGVFITTYLFF